MFYSSRKGTSSATRKQTSFTSKTTSTKHEDGNKSGNETDCGSAELLDISTSREDLSPSRCSCQSGGSNVAVRNEAREAGSEHIWSGNLRLEFDNNGGSDDEQLKDELLRIFDRERLGLESYFKQKTENILAGYRRKQYDWEEKVRLERMEYEKTLVQEKIEVQQSYISEMTNLTKQFNQERVELESHYKKQIEELSQQFELRKKEMDATILKERTELKERLELEYQAMLKSQKAAEEQRYHLQISELGESYKKKIVELEQKLTDSFSEGELSGRRLQSDLEAKFEREKSLVIVEWRKRVELLEVELGKEKERANREERKACESVGFLRNEISKKDVELEKLRQVVKTSKLELSHKEKTAKEHEMLQQNIFLRGSDALPGKLREDFEKMLAAHREELERNLRKEREGLETEREARLVLERETMEKQLKVERERLSLDLEKERSEMRQASREKEDRVREEVREEMERMRAALESEKLLLREQVAKEKDEALVKEKQVRDVEIAREKEIFTEQIRAEMMKEKHEMFLKDKEELREQIRTELMNEKQVRDADKHSRFNSQEQQRNKGQGLMKEKDLRQKLPGKSKEELESNFEGMKSQQGRDQVMMRGDEGLGQNHVRFEAEEAERRRNGLGRDEYEVRVAGQRMQHTKQWVEGQFWFTSDAQGYMEDSAGNVQGKDGLERNRYGGNGGEDGSDGEEADKGYVDGKKGQLGLRNDNHGYFEGNDDRYGEGRDRNDVDNKRCNDDGLRRKRQGRGAGPLRSQEDPGNHEVILPRYQDLLSSEPDRSHPTDMSRNPGKPDNPDKENSVRGLREENEGLKAKVGALQENIELHECFKKEASEEVQRLRNTNKDLKMKHEGLKDTLNDCEELKATLQDCEEQLKDYEVQLKDNEETLKEYEDICAEYERSLQKCRQRIMDIENDQTSSPVFHSKPDDGWNKPGDSPNKLADGHNKPDDGRNKLADSHNKPDDSRNKLADSRNKPDDSRNKLADSHNKPDDGRNKLADSRNKPDDGRNKLADSRNKPDDGRNKLADSRNKPDDGRNKPADSRNKPADSHDKPDDGRDKPADSRKHPESVSKGPKETEYQGMTDDNSDNNGYARSQDKPRNEMMVDILENEKARLEQVVRSLEEKIKLLEIKISEITLHKANTDSTAKLSSDLERVRRQNKGLVNKVKGLQCQLQAMLEKLRKKKKEIASLKDENQSLKSSHQWEISDFQRKLEYSSEVITRLQHESSRESNHVSRLKEEISNISKIMMEERVCEQRMIRARSIEEIRDLDRDKVDMERKLNDARTALDGYSERLKTKMSFSQITGSQLSLNTDTTLVRDLRLSNTLQALEDTQRTSRHQNERLQHEKHELQTLISRLCKSQEDIRNIDGSRTYKEPSSSRSSSMSSLSSSCVSLFDAGKCGLGSTRFSRTFSIFD